VKNAPVLFIAISVLLALSPLAANALTFTLSDDAIMALDYDESNYFVGYNEDIFLLSVTDVNGPGVKFDILFSDPYNLSGHSLGALYRVSSSFGEGSGLLAGRDIYMFDAFALKFTLLSSRSA
jgi:hypothetical protein